MVTFDRWTKQIFFKLIDHWSWFRHPYLFLQYLNNRIIKERSTEKIFVIGLNKTGTTSMKKALEDFGYKIGDQIDAELMLDYVLQEKYTYFNHYLKTAEAFQDLPFGTRGLYKYLYQRYPDAKFILTLRENEDTWFNSLNRFFKKRLKKVGYESQSTPRVKDTTKLNYRYRGFDYDIGKKLWHVGKSYVDDNDIMYDEDYCKFYYRKHEEEVREFFKEKKNLLVLNIEEDDAYDQLCSFLNKTKLYDTLPKENVTNTTAT